VGVPPPAEKPPEKKKDRKPTKNQVAGEHYRSEWMEKYQASNCVLEGPHWIMLAWMMEQVDGDADRLCKIISAYLSDNDPFYMKARHPLEMLRKFFNRFLAKGPAPIKRIERQPTRAEAFVAERSDDEIREAVEVYIADTPLLLLPKSVTTLQRLRSHPRQSRDFCEWFYSKQAIREPREVA
jgi:hypothetical protein